MIQQEIGNRFGEGYTLNNISANYYIRGDYDTGLEYSKQALIIQQEIGDKRGESVTLHNISSYYNAQGDYEAVLEYLERSLSIKQEIGDREGLCATLCNIGYVYWQKEEQQYAIIAWVNSYRIAKAINEFQSLQVLESLAGKLGLPGGLDGWEQLSRQMGENEGGAES